MAGTQRITHRLSTLAERFLTALLTSLNLSSHSLEIAWKKDKKKIRFCTRTLQGQRRVQQEAQPPLKPTCSHFQASRTTREVLLPWCPTRGR